MLTTMELRWFYRGTIPEEIKQWFGADSLVGHLTPPEEREDLYLYAAGCDYLGIKFRQNKLEVKWRQEELGVLRADKVEGKAEKWVKWSCKDPTPESFLVASVAEKGEWVSVKKVRSQRLYETCAVEIAQVNIRDNDWWSLGFETLGEDEHLMDNLKAVASQLFQSYHGSLLQAQDSFAYPKLLALVVE